MHEVRKNGRVEELLSQMSIEDKLHILTPLDGEYGRIRSLDFHGPIPQDVPRGGEDNWKTGKPVYGEDGRPSDGKYHPVALPSNSSVAMSWNKELVCRVGKLFALEAKANPDKVNILNRPGMNLKRSPLCGRNYDYLSEDPVLTGLLATEYVKGIQSEGVGACPKHFIANNQEYDRMNTDSHIEENVFHEIYLRPWKLMLRNAEPWMIMSSYNKVNGEWVNSSKQCMDALREDIGYQGVVVSDFQAVHHNKIASHNNGMDIELSDPQIHIGELREALRTGAITEGKIDEIVRRVLGMAVRAEECGDIAEVDMDSLHKEAQTIAAQCITLMKNDNVLPLDLVGGKTILVAGQLAAEPVVEGSGSGYMNGYQVDIPLDEVKKTADLFGIMVEYSQGYEVSEKRPPVDPEPDETLLTALGQSVEKADIVLAYVGSPYGYESEGYDRPHIRLQQNQQAMLDVLTGITDNVIIILTGGSVYDLAPWNDKVKGVIYAGMAGEGYGRAIADILFGNMEPGGRLTETFPLREEHGPSYFDFTPSEKEMPTVNYTEGLLVGYRWYDTRKLPVLYPFGHGLSYTSFAYSDFSINKKIMRADEEATVSLSVTNTGERSGSQVIQMYVHMCDSLYQRPEKELRDFVKVYLEPGETKQISFLISRKDFEVYSVALHKWGVQDGDYDVLLNTSASDNIAEGRIRITKGDQMFLFTDMTPLVRFVNCPAFHEYLKANKPVGLQDFFNLEKTDFLVLMLPLPIYRLAEPLQGEPMFTETQIAEMIACCNEYMAYQ
ncbi:MAG: hypothetical protein HDR13_16225 [Lachnospiraceae bacterium]|nr:hypothetical protein [Lachnospiraceae bacterium]